MLEAILEVFLAWLLEVLTVIDKFEVAKVMCLRKWRVSVWPISEDRTILYGQCTITYNADIAV